MSKIFKMALSLIGLCGSLSACSPASQDQFGSYVDGAYYVVVSHSDKKIHFVEDAHPGPDSLLAEIKAGKGFSYKLWRTPQSCGLEDFKGNVFLIPRQDEAIVHKGLRYQLETTSKEILDVNGGRDPSMQFITVWDDKNVSLSYGYDEALGIRTIDRYQNGAFDRRIILENGVGLLAHCRGFSFEDHIERP
jgi:hypothetical protein